jgi:hypothetical protein
MRIGAALPPFDEAARADAGTIESSTGSAMAVPKPRNNVRRDRDFFEMIT